jgi:CHAT domain-containing protein
MRRVELYVPLLIICWFFQYGISISQPAFDAQIGAAFADYRAKHFAEALRACRRLSDTLAIFQDSSRVQLAILKYYENRLYNRRRQAIHAMEAVSHLSSEQSFSPALKAQFIGLLSMASIEANMPDQIAFYDSFWSKKENLSPFELIQKERISWYKAHVTNSLSDQKLHLEFILGVLLKYDLNRHPEMLLVLRDLGILSKKLSDFEPALDYFTQEKNLYLHYFDSSHVCFGIAEYHIASIYYETLEFQKSLDHFLVVQKNFENLNMPNRRMRYVYEAIGDMNFELGNTQEAAQYWHKASQYRTVKNKDLLDRKTPLIDSFIRTNHVNQAITMYEDALAFREQEYGKQHQLTAQCHTYIGRAYTKKNHHRKSAEKYHQALQIYIPSLVDTSITSSPENILPISIDMYLLEALVGKSNALHELYLQDGEKFYLAAAHDHIKVAENALKNLRVNPRSETSQLALSKLSRQLIESGLAVSYERYRQQQETSSLDQVLSLMELSRGFLLHQALQQSKAFDIVNVPPGIIQQEQELRNEMSTYTAKIDMEVKLCSDANEEYVTTWKKHLTQIRIQHNELIDHISKSYPAFYKLKFDYNTVSIADIQSRILSEDGLAISYFQGVNHLYALVIGSDHASLHQMNYQINLSVLIDSLKMCLSDYDYILSNPQLSRISFIRTAASLYDQLLRSISLPLGKTKQLIIIPDLDLHRIPFEVLLTQKNSRDASYNQLNYLLNAMNISYGNSFNLLLEGIDHKNQLRQNYIGFAPSYRSAYNDVITMREYGNLSFNESEVKSAANLFDGQSYSGHQATKAAFVESATKGKILHIAAHAIIDDEYPLLSHILFSPTRPDSVLHAYEIYNQPIKADLTVLSACNTGVGKIHAGEGAMSLSRAFQYAGCPSLMMTLWSVDDQGSSEIMELFFHKLRAGQSKNQSLADAKRHYLSTADPASAHPFYWAGYVIVGNVGEIDLSTSMNYNWILGLLFLSFLIWLVKSRKIKTSR